MNEEATKDIKIRVSRELLSAMFTRDSQGNRLSFDLGEPDEDGFYKPLFTTHCEDNIVAVTLRQVGELDKRCRELEAQVRDLENKRSILASFFWTSRDLYGDDLERYVRRMEHDPALFSAGQAAPEPPGEEET